MENSRVAKIFDEIADLLELQQKNRFRGRLYRHFMGDMYSLRFPATDKTKTRIVPRFPDSSGLNL